MKNFKKVKKDHIRLGKIGEKYAKILLQNKGMKILTQNYRTKQGELDIVARDGMIIVFVEVKTLHKIGKFRPKDNYKIKQIQRNYRAGLEYISRLGNPEVQFRFDFIEVVCGFWKIKELRHYQRFI